MANIVTFSSLGAKLKGMYAKNLKKSDYEELIRQESIEKVIALLKQKLPALDNITISSGRRELEEKLYQVLVHDTQKIYRYLNHKERALVDCYLEKYEILYLKESVKQYLTKGKIHPDASIWHRPMFKNIQELVVCDRKEDWMLAISKTKYHKIFEVFFKQQTTNPENALFTLETALEKTYLQEWYQVVKKNHCSLLQELIGKQIDLYNILLIYRFRKYHQADSKKIEPYIIPIYYQLKPYEIKEMIETYDLEEAIGHTAYHRVIHSLMHIEEDIQTYLLHFNISMMRKHSFNIALVICYLQIKEQELNNIIQIVEGVRYHLNRERLQKKITI